MSKICFNIDGGKSDEYGTFLAQQRLFTGEVGEGCAVAANASPSMGVRVQAGSFRIPRGTAPSNYWTLCAIDTASPGEAVTISTSNPSNPRRDLIVAYIDTAVTPTTSVTNNSNNIVKLAAVAGTPAASPSDPNSAAIQAAIGASNPYIILARIAVGTGVTQITNSDITDLRQVIRPLNGSAALLYNPYKFSAYRSSNQAFTSGVFTKIQYNTEEFDTGSNYDNATNYRFTAPIAGFYFFSAQIQVLEGNAGLVDCQIVLYKNGTAFRKGGNIKDAAYPQPHVDGLLSLAAGDYIEVYFINNLSSSNMEGLQTSSNFHGFLVSAT
jgi:hypothetical protein